MPTGLALRLGQGVIIGWAAALAIGGLVGGLVAQSVSSAVNGALKKKFAHSRDAYQRFLATWPDETDRLPGSVRGLRDRQAFERVRRDREMTKQPSSVVTAATQTAS